MEIEEKDIGKAIHTYLPKWIDPLTNREGPLEEWIYLIVEVKKDKILVRNAKTGKEHWSKKYWFDNWSFYEKDNHNHN